MVLLAVNFDNLHQILQSLYTDMMPLCSQMTGVAKGLAGLGALFYVAYRVWQSLARRAESAPLLFLGWSSQTMGILRILTPQSSKI